MLTPQFKVWQSDLAVHLQLRVPFIRVQEVEMDLQGPQFKFYAPPYFLRLQFPGSLIENGQEKASLDIASGWLTLSLPKEIPGQEFPDLDLLSKLLASSSSTNSQLPSPPIGPKGILIQDLSVSHSHPCTNESDLSESGSPSAKESIGTNDQEYNWEYPQILAEEPLPGMHSSFYGFNNEYSQMEAHFHAMAHELLDVTDLDQSHPASRRKERLIKEAEAFDPEHYQADFLGDKEGELKEILEFKPVYWMVLKERQRRKKLMENEPTRTKKEEDLDEFQSLSLEEQTELAQLKYKEYLIDNDVPLYLGLVDLIYSYCYNHRTTEGEGTVESPWTLCKLSSTLSCFDTFTSLKDVVLASTRRSLVYPLHRNWSLSLLLWKDVTILFKLGKRPLLKCLLEMKKELEGDEITFSFSRVWIVDYCIWLQSAKDEKIQSLAKQLHHMTLSKTDLLPDFDLVQLEIEALSMCQDDPETP